MLHAQNYKKCLLDALRDNYVLIPRLNAKEKEIN
jgi:hypothetical protein